MRNKHQISNIKEYEMQAEQFIVWLRGYLELSEKLTDREVKIKSALDRLSPLDFCYWISGSFECGGYALTKAELAMKDHLVLVFTKVTPDRIDIIQDYPFQVFIQPFLKDDIPSYPSTDTNITIC